jgi:hypothetical protein
MFLRIGLLCAALTGVTIVASEKKNSEFQPFSYLENLSLNILNGVRKIHPDLVDWCNQNSDRASEKRCNKFLRSLAKGDEFVSSSKIIYEELPFLYLLRGTKISFAFNTAVVFHKLGIKPDYTTCQKLDDPVARLTCERCKEQPINDAMKEFAQALADGRFVVHPDADQNSSVDGTAQAPTSNNPASSETSNN